MGKSKSDSGKVFPWFRVFASEFLSETGELTPSETGIYVKLLAVMHLHAEPIVDDIGRLARRVGADIRVFKPARAALIEAGLIILRDGKLWSALSEGELEHITARSQIARSNVATRHQKSKQKQRPISTDVNKNVEDRIESVEDDVPSEHHPSSTSLSPQDHVADSGSEAARASAAPTYQDGDKITIPGVGVGSVVRTIMRRPYTLIAEFQTDGAFTALFVMQQRSDGTFKQETISRARAEEYPAISGDIDRDRTA